RPGPSRAPRTSAARPPSPSPPPPPTDPLTGPPSHPPTRRRPAAGPPPAAPTPPVGSAVCRGFGSGQCRFGGELPTSRVGGWAGGWGESARVGGEGGRRVSGGGRRGRGPRDGAPS